jgi:hypothetical protein
MLVDKRTQDAIQRIVASPEGGVFTDYLRKQLDADYEALVMAEQPEQTRRLQGTARRTKELLVLFSSK